MAKFKGASGPFFLLCPVVRRQWPNRRYRDHTLTPTGRVRHRANPYGRRHQDEYRCSCGRLFWTNYNWRSCPLRPGSVARTGCPPPKVEAPDAD